jgi:hypothetical protein
MTTHTTRQGPARSAGAAARGGIAFAAMLMILTGSMQLLQGLVALVDEDFYVARQEYLFQLGVTTWGWVHAVLGLVVALVGVGLLSGRAWARTAAVVLAALSVMANFLWLPYYPLWSLTVIAFGGFVIWALALRGEGSEPS